MAMTLRLSETEDALLTELAKAEQRSKHDVVVLAIKERAARSGRRADMDRFLDDVLETDKTILDLLSR
ncbi:hypothetical protein [Cellulomonas sp.]|uniref:hypothetical protein n=1 Tax=Cellulomonas sp. TaxID=40001 RepID=UPI001B2568D9|nr:hypothetical protein [Cellulomonas sp.]MBO9553969.1 toxin-antitoxin system protein [Cellulomonas sp.]